MSSYFQREQHIWIPSLDDTGNGTSTLYDLKGTKNGTLNGGADWVPNVVNKGIRAIDLDGVDSYVSCGTLTDSTRAAVSAGGWIYPRSYVNQQVLIQNLDTGAGLQGFLLGQGTAGQGQKWRAYLDTNSSSNNAVDTATFSLNVWQHVFFTYDGTTIRLYVNGSEVATAALTGSIPDTATCNIGLYSGIYTDALIDDVRVVRSALTATQVSEIYDGRRGYLRPSTPRLTRLGLTGTPTGNRNLVEDQTIYLGAAGETDSAQALTISGSQTIALNTATETDTVSALTVVNPRTYAVGTASETDTASSLTVAQDQTVVLGTASESDTAQSLTVVNPRTYALTTATETDSAETLTVIQHQIVSLGSATETDTAQTLTVVNPRSYTLSTATETDTASSLSLINPRTYQLGTATETDTANSLTVQQASIISLGTATETDTAQTLTVVNPKSYSLGVASETSTVSSLTVVNPRSYTLSTATATETALSLTIVNPRTYTLSTAVETDTAPALTVSLAVIAIDYLSVRGEVITAPTASGTIELPSSEGTVT